MTDMSITIEQLIQCVKESVKTLTICVPATDYYSRRGDWEESYTSVVDPVTLIDELEKLIEDGLKHDSTAYYATESWED